MAFRPKSTHVWPTLQWLLFMLLHIPLGLLFRNYPLTAGGHAVVVSLIGSYYALAGKSERVAYVAAYIMGAEVLWRMTNAPIPHEFAKYALSTLFMISLLQQRKFRLSGMAIAYFVLMLPSISLVMGGYDSSTVGDMLSFNLSGPLTLMMSAIFFLNRRFTYRQTIIIMFAAIPPIISIAANAFYLIRTTSVTYNVHSALARSGNYAPNQVSALLGLAALLAYIILVAHGDHPKKLRALLGGILLWMAIQSSLTFSRGGVIIAAISAVMISFAWVKDQGGFLRIVSIVVLLLLGGLFIFPQLIESTNGAIIERFSSLDPTGRDQIAQGDILLWQDNFWFGVGPGVSSRIRPGNPFVAAHTEFTRTLADHGILGMLSNVLFLLMAITAWNKAKGIYNKGLVVGILTWSILYMVDSATRVVAPSFLFGLAFSLGSISDEVPLIQTSDSVEQPEIYFTQKGNIPAMRPRKFR